MGWGGTLQNEVKQRTLHIEQPKQGCLREVKKIVSYV